MPRGCWWALTRSGHPSSRKKGNTKRADSLDPTTDPEGIGMNNRPNMATNLDNAFGSLGVATSTSEDVKNVNMRSYEDGIKFPSGQIWLAQDANQTWLDPKLGKQQKNTNLIN